MAEVKFSSFQWETDEGWKKYKSSIDITSGNEEEVMEKVKRRYYKKFIDSTFEATPPSQSSSYSSGDDNDSNQSSQQSNTYNNYSYNQNTYVPNTPPSSSSFLGSIFQKLGRFGINSRTIWFAASVSVVIHTILYLFSFFDPEFSYNCYYRALKSALLAYGASLFSVAGPLRLNREYFALLATNDNSHYLFLCIILNTAYPITVPLLIISVYSVFNLTVFISDNVGNTPFAPIYRKYFQSYFQKVISYQHQILLQCANAEMVALLIVFIESIMGRGGLLLVIGYYWFLNFRYLSSSYSRMLLENLGYKLDGLFNNPLIPSFIKNGYNAVRTSLRNSVQPRPNY